MKILITLFLFLASNAAAFDVGGSLPQGLGDGRYVLKSDGIVTGSAFSVGGSTLVVANGRVSVGLGTANMYGTLQSYRLNNDTVSPANSILYLAGDSVATGLVVQNKASSPYATVLQAENLAANSFFPISLNPAGGNVGVGTTAPGSGIGGNGVKFEVATNDTAESSEIIVSNNSTADGYITGSLESYSGSSDNKRTAGVFFATDGSNVTDANGQIQFYTSNAGTLAQKAVITKGGNVGIGVTTPSHTLEVNGSGKFVGIDASSVTVSGFSRLGELSTGFKTITFSTTSATFEGSYTTVTHGVTASKIISISSVLWDAPGQSGVLPSSTVAGYKYRVSFDATKIYVELDATESETILNKSVKILMFYEE